MDILVSFNRFANATADAMNAAGVRPDPDQQMSAVMVVVATPPDAPLGGALNFDTTLGKWVVDIQLEHSERVDSVEEAQR
jgi:hypothetical protein